MREQPSSKSALINKIPLNTKVEVLEIVNDEWTKIKYKDMIGYVMSKFLIKETTPETNYTKQQLLQIQQKLQEASELVEQLIKILE